MSTVDARQGWSRQSDGPRGLSEVTREVDEASAPKEAGLEPREKLLRLVVFVPREGRELTAQIKSVVPLGDESARFVGVLTRMTGGVPWELLTPNIRALAMARAEVAIQVKDAPPWLDQMLMQDAYADLLFDLAEELAAHRRRYFRPDLGEGQEGQEPRRLLVAIHAAGAAAP